jgi:hypothetical protein
MQSAAGLTFAWRVPEGIADPSPVVRLRATADGRRVGSAAVGLCVFTGDDSDIRWRVLWLTSRPEGDGQRACELRHLGIAAKVVDLRDAPTALAELGRAPGAYDVVVVSPELRLPVPMGLPAALAGAAARGCGLVLDGYVQRWRDTALGALCPLAVRGLAVMQEDQGLRWADAQAPLVWGLDAGQAARLKWVPIAAPARDATVLAYTDEGLPILAARGSVVATSLPVLSLRTPQWETWAGCRPFAAGAIVLAAGGGAADFAALRAAPPSPVRNAKVVREALR